MYSGKNHPNMKKFKCTEKDLPPMDMHKSRVPTRRPAVRHRSGSVSKEGGEGLKKLNTMQHYTKDEIEVANLSPPTDQ
jgi:hypothetical protein